MLAGLRSPIPQFVYYTSSLMQSDDSNVRVAAAALIRGAFQTNKTLARDILSDVTQAPAVRPRCKRRG